jgi:fibro-slime domain-containing protein
MRPTALVRALVATTAITGSFGPAIAAAEPGDPTPSAITIQAVIRDFKAFNDPGGHDDFQRYTGVPRVGMLADQLGGDGKPVLQSRFGSKLTHEFTDLQYRPVRPQFVLDGTIDGIPGLLEPATEPRVWSEESFASWYRDVPGVNMATVVPIVLAETEAGSGVYVFDSNHIDPDLNPRFADLPLPGFFPINDQLFGNYQGFDNGSTNFHFTTEISTTFVYSAGAGHTFAFAGDDDIWVYIDGRLVIDLGGVHGVAEQTVSLDTLDWLTDGDVYTLHVFHAERRTAQSNFRIETTIPLRPFRSVLVADAFD